MHLVPGSFFLKRRLQVRALRMPPVLQAITFAPRPKFNLTSAANKTHKRSSSFFGYVHVVSGLHYDAEAGLKLNIGYGFSLNLHAVSENTGVRVAERHDLLNFQIRNGVQTKVQPMNA